MCLSLQNERFDAACSYIKFDRRRVKHHHQTVVSYRLALFLRRQEGVTFPNSSRCNLIRKFLKTKLKMLFVSLPTTVSKRYRLLQFKNIFLNKVLHIFLVPLFSLSDNALVHPLGSIWSSAKWSRIRTKRVQFDAGRTSGRPASLVAD